MSVEHIAPRALWNRNLPGGNRTVPAHVECNRASSDDIDDFRDFLALDEATNRQPEVQRLLKGKLKRKIEKRSQSMRRQMRPVALPNISPSDLLPGHAVYMQIDPLRIVRVLRNIDAESTLVDLFGRLDQLLQANEPFSSCFDATCQPNEMQTSFHDVVGAPVAGNHRSGLAPPYTFLLPPGEFVKRRLEGALVYLLTRMGLFNCLQSSCRGDASVALPEVPDRRRQIEAVALSSHAIMPSWW